jgi:hypothetical protein
MWTKKYSAPAGIFRTSSHFFPRRLIFRERCLCASVLFGRVFARLLGQKGAFEPGSSAVFSGSLIT